ncbi:hypothetical protein RRG08_058410 [Elysia crispata]|uniref:Uncharacterized protein n=1 Tax=Elysia crispata TaxID=231223 RepID=A0AAE0XWA2_9GAST|nr:hypothetical protein RRG08_058410 [Elysia crispata]
MRSIAVSKGQPQVKLLSDYAKTVCCASFLHQDRHLYAILEKLTEILTLPIVSCEDRSPSSTVTQFEVSSCLAQSTISSHTNVPRSKWDVLLGPVNHLKSYQCTGKVIVTIIYSAPSGTSCLAQSTNSSHTNVPRSKWDVLLGSVNHLKSYQCTRKVIATIIYSAPSGTSCLAQSTISSHTNVPRSKWDVLLGSVNQLKSYQCTGKVIVTIIYSAPSGTSCLAQSTNSSHTNVPRSKWDVLLGSVNQLKSYQCTGKVIATWESWDVLLGPVNQLKSYRTGKVIIALNQSTNSSPMYRGMYQRIFINVNPCKDQTELATFRCHFWEDESDDIVELSKRKMLSYGTASVYLEI